MDHLHKPEAGSVVPIPQSGGSAKRKADDMSDNLAEEASRKLACTSKHPLATQRSQWPQISDYGEMVTIEVGTGEQKRTFYVYEGLLSFYSGYFRAALSGKWKEAETGHFDLKDEEVDVFERFVFWLNTRRPTDETLSLTADLIIRLWLFADRREIPLLMNQMIAYLKNYITENSYLPDECLNLVYESTLLGSPLRRMLIASFASLCDQSTFEDETCFKLWPKEALWDLTKALSANPRPVRMTEEQYKLMDICLFHVHEDGTRCLPSRPRSQYKQKSDQTAAVTSATAQAIGAWDPWSTS